MDYSEGQSMAPAESINQIVTAITQKVGLAQSGRGMTFVLPVTKVAGMSTNVAPVFVGKEVL